VASAAAANASSAGENQGGWFMMQAVASPGAENPSLSSEEEAGPETGNSGTFPVEVNGPDPWNPMNGNVPLPPSNVVQPVNRFPAEPQQWVSQPGSQWIEHPMQFNPPNPAHTAVGDPRYVDEGVETGPGPNPFSFDRGTEGVQGQSGQFPEDVSLSEPDERVDLYQNPPTGGFSGSQGAQASLRSQSATTNAGSCAKCNGPIYREGSDTWHHLNGGADHGVHLPYDHPWVQSRMSVLRTANQYIKPNPDGDGYVITQKGTGKILSHHDTEEKAQEAFSAMMMNKHSARQPLQPRDHVILTEDVHDSDHNMGKGIVLPKGHRAQVDHVTDPGEDADGNSWVALRHPSTSDRHDVVYAAPHQLRRAPQRQAAHQAGPQFFDPSLRHMADASTGDLSDSTATSFGTGDQAATQTPGPSTPSSMTQGGAGAESAASPIPTQTSTDPTSVAGGAGLGDDPGGADAASKMSMFRMADDGDVRQRPTQFNTRAGDEYTANTWENALTTAPRQTAEDRRVNTPQQPNATEAIPQTSSGGGEQDEEDERGREASYRRLFSTAAFSASEDLIREGSA
jgi:hypothetical protein